MHNSRAQVADSRAPTGLRAGDPFAMSAELAERALSLLRICPYCYGKRQVPYDGVVRPECELVDCERCEGSGDYIGSLMLRCYRAGRDDALDEIRSAMRQVADMAERAQPHTLNAEQMRMRVPV